MLDHVGVVLVGIAILQLFVSNRAPAVWRYNLEAEVHLAEAVLKIATEPHLVNSSSDQLLAVALESLRTRLRHVESQVNAYDGMLWFQKALFDVSTFQGHADWIRQWRDEWTVRVQFPTASNTSSSTLSEKLQTPVHHASARRPPAPHPPPPGPRAGPHTEDADIARARPILEQALQLMDTQLASSFVQERGCELLFTLVTDEGTRQIATSHGGASLVLQAMATYPAEATVQGHCSGAISGLAGGGAALEFPFTKGMRAVLDAMATHLGAELVQERGCAALASLVKTASGSGGHITDIARAVLRGMRKHPKVERVQGFCVDALSSLVAMPDGRSVITSLGSTKTVKRALQAHPEATALQLVGAKLLGILRG